MKIEIKKVNNTTPLKDDLLKYINDFSWVDVKEHMSMMISEWMFEEWETPFVAITDGKIVGMCTIMKRDFYPIDDIYPWISSIFVSEEYRGNKISGLLIKAAEEYALSLNFEKTYIPSSHVGLYEKYDYVFEKEIINYGGEIDRLYSKQLV